MAAACQSRIGRQASDDTSSAGFELCDRGQNKRQAENIEARERSRILDGRHGIRRQPDITFKAFAEIYPRDRADLHKKSANRDREILKTLDRFSARESCTKSRPIGS